MKLEESGPLRYVYLVAKPALSARIFKSIPVHICVHACTCVYVYFMKDLTLRQVVDAACHVPWLRRNGAAFFFTQPM